MSRPLRPPVFGNCLIAMHLVRRRELIPAVATSIGLAVYPQEADTIVDLIKLADSAMYASPTPAAGAPDRSPGMNLAITGTGHPE